MFLHIGSIVDIIPLLLYPNGEICEEEIQELNTHAHAHKQTERERDFDCCLSQFNNSDVFKNRVSYHVHLPAVQRFDNVAKMLKPNVMKDERGEVTDNCRAT